MVSDRNTAYVILLLIVVRTIGLVNTVDGFGWNHCITDIVGGFGWNHWIRNILGGFGWNHLICDIVGGFG